MKHVEVKTDTLAAILPTADGLVFPIPASKDKADLGAVLAALPDAARDAALAFATRVRFEGKAKQSMSFDAGGVRIVVLAVASDIAMFDLLTAARNALEPVAASKAKRIALETRLLDERAGDLADAFASALGVRRWVFKKATKKPDKPAPADADDVPAALHILASPKQRDAVAARAELAEQQAEGTNLVRELTRRAANDLDCAAYVSLLEETARQEGLIYKFLAQSTLEAMGAGAFLAVARGSSHRDAGIVALSTFTPGARDPKRKHLVLVGKGIVFDTGGVNVKPADYMFGMEGDMMGSAVALALILAAKRSQWPIDVSAYLAIADNALGEKAYRPNEVVHSLKGTTIETVHTDAEGRMVLADTLHLAAQEKPDLIMDFATLTGACIRAIGSTYAGVFTNRLPELRDRLETAGRVTGERVWAFPLDEDFGTCLESEVADMKQCRLKGGVDHIEAAYFLKHFVGEEIPWVHVDLSAAAHTGGLAHVGGDLNGFGVRFATQFLRDYFRL